MGPAQTERADGHYDDLDLWPAERLVDGLVTAQRDALAAVSAAGPALAAAVEVLAAVLRAGGRMAYAGAGSSGLVAEMDALELPGTFGIAPDRVPVIQAGGEGPARALSATAEDDGAAAEAAVDGLRLGAADALVAVAASGSTPFTLAALRRARARGAVTLGLACVPGTPLLDACDHPILIETPPEPVAGSTRMGAGTAQKCALNILSTGVALRLGHGYRGLMVNMRPDNAKLRQRAVGIVARAAGVDEARAAGALDDAGWSVKTAVVACAAAVDPAAARTLLEGSHGDVRAALAWGTGGRSGR